MYLKHLTIENLRCFRKAELNFVYPQDDEAEPKSKLRCPNVNLLLGGNGVGKTTVLKAVALTTLSPVLEASGFRPYWLVRREENFEDLSESETRAKIKGQFLLHLQEQDEGDKVTHKNIAQNPVTSSNYETTVEIVRLEDYEQLESERKNKAFERILSKDQSPAFLLLGYGATRRTELLDNFDEGARIRSRSPRYQRVAGLFEDQYSHFPMGAWLTQLERMREGQFNEFVEVVNAVLPDGVSIVNVLEKKIQRISRNISQSFLDEIREFTDMEIVPDDIFRSYFCDVIRRHMWSNGNMYYMTDVPILAALGEANSFTEFVAKDKIRPISSEWQEIKDLLAEFGTRYKVDQPEYRYVFGFGNSSVPFAALSDGYKAMMGWLGDLLYHLTQICSPRGKLRDLRGIVMVDEIDLHLHPSWQREVIEKLSKTFPRIQWIFTSHSPLVAGTLEPDNIIVMESQADGTVLPVRYKEHTFGRSADQLLTSPYFGLLTTRAPGAEQTLEDLARRAAEGDTGAVLDFLEVMKSGVPEVTENNNH